MKINERLANSFAPAAYGYWINPEGTILPVQKTHGHIDFLMDRYDFIHLSPTQPNDVWYNEALSLGWVRVIASNNNHHQFNMQFKMLNSRTRESLIDLIDGLMTYDIYLYESKDYLTFDQRGAIRFVKNFSGHNNYMMAAETWTP